MLEVQEYFRRVIAFKKFAESMLARHESSVQRVITIEHTYKELKNLNVKQDELLRQSLRCIENSLFRAAHVLAFAGLMDFLEEKLAQDGFATLKRARPNWLIRNLEDLREKIPDHQIIEVLNEIGYCSKTEKKALHGLLNKRNECAHPSDYYPNLNETLGYVSEIISRISSLQKKWLQSG
jgi:hypothetical protein